MPGDAVQFIDDLNIRGGRLGSEMTVALTVEDAQTREVLSRNSYTFTAD